MHSAGRPLKTQKQATEWGLGEGGFADTRADSLYHSFLKSNSGGPGDCPRSRGAANFLVFGNFLFRRYIYIYIVKERELT